MMEYPALDNPYYGMKGVVSQMAWDYEIFNKIFHHHNIVPIWVNATYPYGGTKEEIENYTPANQLVTNTLC